MNMIGVGRCDVMFNIQGHFFDEQSAIQLDDSTATTTNCSGPNYSDVRTYWISPQQQLCLLQMVYNDLEYTTNIFDVAR
jgi:hypothetical protein